MQQTTPKDTLPISQTGNARETLPELIDRATFALQNARNSAEVLEARDLASVAYDAAKVAGRMARAKEAHDTLLSEVYRAQADALMIESRAKIRLADEIDAADEHRHKGRPKSVTDVHAFSAADLGLDRKEIQRARELRDLESEDPGVIESILSDRIARGEEPTKASIRQAVEELKRPHVAQNSGENEWYTPDWVLDAARTVLGEIDLDPASSEIANRRVKAKKIYTKVDDGLAQSWYGQKVWMNPPYAQPLIAQFCEKFAFHISRDGEGIALVNNATETSWFQQIAEHSTAICFPKGRVRFLDPAGNLGAPLQGQAIIYGGKFPDCFRIVFSDFGLVVHP